MRGRGIFVSIAIVVLLVLAFVYAPGRLQMTAAALLLIGVGFSIVSIARQQAGEYRSGSVSRAAAIRSALIHILRLFISLGLSIALAGRAVLYVTGLVGGLAGFVLAIAAAMAAGIGVNMLVRRVFDLPWRRPA